MYAKGNPHVERPGAIAVRPELVPKTITVIARDFRRQLATGSGRFRDGRKGFAPHFQQVIRVASDQGADTVLFSLWSHNAGNLRELSRSDLFPRGTRHSAVILGIIRQDGESKKDKEVIEVWHRSRRMPFRLFQYFGKTSAPRAQKESLISAFAERQFGPTLVLLCGEVNIVRTKRATRGIVDDFRFLSLLRGSQTECILNPIHSHMRRYEMVYKREALAQAAGSLISVWNRGLQKGSESNIPWALYKNGRTVKGGVREIKLPVPSQPGIRMGIITLR